MNREYNQPTDEFVVVVSDGDGAAFKFRLQLHSVFYELSEGRCVVTVQY